MRRIIENLLYGSLFHNLAAVHYDHTVAHTCDNAKVMRDHNDRHSKLIPKLQEQVKNLRLDGYVKRRGRLVTDHQSRSAYKSDRDHDTLFHTAG